MPREIQSLAGSRRITQHVPWRSPTKSAIIGNWFPAALVVTQHCWVLGLVSYYQHSGDLASDPACLWVRPSFRAGMANHALLGWVPVV